MTGIASMLHEAADVAESAAVGQQQAQLAGPERDPAIIGRLELTADHLRDAAAVLEPAPLPPRRAVMSAVLMTSVQTVSCLAVLLAVPDPAHPLALAAAIGGTGVLAKLANDLTESIRARREVRELAGAIDESVDARETVAELRARIGTITRALEPEDHDLHLEVGRRIESAKAWLDYADQGLA